MSHEPLNGLENRPLGIGLTCVRVGESCAVNFDPAVIGFIGKLDLLSEDKPNGFRRIVIVEAGR